MKAVLSALFVVAFAGAACNGSGNGGGGGGTTPTPAAPTITSVTPSSGTAAGGTAVTVAGTNFATGATVAIGGIALTGVSVTPTSITGTTGASSTASVVSVTVTNPGGGTASLPNGFSYQSVARAAISGAPAVVQHNFPVNFSGLTSTTTTPATIREYRWNCGQDPGVYGAGCEVANNPTPTFNYRRCGGAGRQPCTTGTQRTYTVTLTVTDTQGSSNTATFTVTVTNGY
jgi:hypothetical protein